MTTFGYAIFNINITNPEEYKVYVSKIVYVNVHPQKCEYEI